jgi:DNA-binding CsgD family transcriptional regulator
MTRDRVARLTEGQRDVLRMVNQHMETKEIARALGISPDGVNQRVKAAMRILAVNKRRDAARILAEAEGEEAYPSQVYQPRDIAPDRDPPTLDASTESGRERTPILVGAMREQQTAYGAAPRIPARRFRLPLPIWGGNPSDLNALHRLGWIFALMLSIAFAFGAFLAGMEALSRLGRAVS